MRLAKAKEACEIINTTLPRLYDLTRKRQIPFIRLGVRSYRYDPDLLKEWAATQAKLNIAPATRSDDQQ